MNKRPCGMCRHLDSRIQNGRAYCWCRFEWHTPEEVVADCDQAERADGKSPPDQLRYSGERR